MARTCYVNELEQIKNRDGSINTEVSFAMRAMDFNPKTGILYTGDDAGYLQAWDLNILLEKLKTHEQRNKFKQEVERKASIEGVSIQQMAASMQ